jgi:iron complex outermembrane receptor protein
MLKKISIIFLILISCASYSLAQTIKGRVLDEKGEPLPSATVVIKELNKGMSSDDMGKFRFSHLPQREVTIEVSFIGYKNHIQKVDLSKQKEVLLEVKMLVSNNLGDVEVFGERYKQPEKLDAITRMPLRPSEQIQSISVISEKVIAEQGALTITDAMRNVPGVTLFGSYGGVKESMSSRGFRGVPVLKNGVRMDSQFQTASGITDMQGVESIQMIKGSAAVTQGVITDIGNAGGVIDVVTKTPKFVKAGQVDLRVGSWGQFRPTFDVQTVLDKDNKTGFRLNGAYERADNYRPVVSSDRVYINPSFEWRPSDKTTITLEGDYLNENRTPVTSTVNFADQGTNALYEMPHSKFLGVKNDNVNTELLTYSARIKHYFTDKLSVRAAYYGSSYQVDNTSTSLDTIRGGYENVNRVRELGRSLRDDKNSTFQLDLVGQDVYTGSVKHTFQLGFDYRIADATTKDLGGLVMDTVDIKNGVIDNSLQKEFADKKTMFSNPDDVPGVNTKYTTYGIMAQEVMTINKYVKAILGLRYSSISTTTTSARGSSPGPTRENAWDPMFGVMISPIENVNVFGSYTTSTSLRSAGNILTDSVTRVGASRTKQWEAGFKSDWLGNRLRFNFTYFHIYTDNLSNSEYLPNSSRPTGYYYLAGDLVRDGIEVELNGRILDNLQVMLGYAYLDARYKNSPSYVDGSAPMNAPKHTANGWVHYTMDRGLLKGLSIGAGVYYVGKRPVNEYSLRPDGHGNMGGTKPFDMPAYTTVNAQLSYTYSKITARVFFNNIFDDLGYNSYFRGGYINQIDPRNFAAMVSYRF